MTSRERVLSALNHKEPDKVPVDLGGAVVTGIQASALARLRKTLGLETRAVKVYEPMMMLGVVEDDVLQAIGGDVVRLNKCAFDSSWISECGLETMETARRNRYGAGMV